MTAPILWWSNGPNVGTGYGTQTAQAVARAARDGHHVEVLANYGAEGAPVPWTSPFGDVITVQPRGMEPFSRDVMLAAWHQFRAEHGDASRFIALADVFVIPDAVTASTPIEAWAPVEHVPLPPDVRHAFDREGTQARPIAMSQFGQQAMADAGIESVYIPHGIEPTFRSTDGGGAIIGVPDDVHLSVIVAANKGWHVERKQFVNQMVAFQQLKKRHDDAMLYIHADPDAPGSISLRVAAETLGLQDRVLFPDRLRYLRGGYTQQDLAAVYTRADIVLSASMGEGFGLCPLEAAACGTPAVVSEFSAQPELACEDSYLVPGDLVWHEGRKAFLFHPHTQSIADALLHAYDHPVYRSQSALDLAARYDADRVWAEYWRPYLARSL